MSKRASDGYVLGWVLIVMLAMSILGMSMLSMAAGSHQKIVREQWGNQAYYTARSVLELAVAQMSGVTTDSGLADAIRRQVESGSTEFDMMVEGMNPAMGTCRLTVVYWESTMDIFLTAYADCNGKTGSVSVRMSGDMKAENQPFTVVSYGDESLPEEWNEGS